MPIQFVKDASGRLVQKGEAQDRTAYVPEKPEPVSKPEKPKQKSWWEQQLNNVQYEIKRIQKDPVKAAQTYATNASGFHQVNNNVNYELKQLRDPKTRGARLATYGANAALGVVSNNNPAWSGVTRMGVQGVATSGANLVRNVGRAGGAIDDAEDNVFRLTGDKTPSEMTPGEKAVNDLKASVVASASLQGIGGAALTRFAPGAMAMLDPAKAPNLVNALGRAITAEGLADTVATFFQDNTGGSALGLVDALFGTKSDPVKPGMTHQEATMAALVPNALAAVGTAGLGVGISAAAKQLFPGNTQAVRGQRIVDEKSRQRQTLESNGVVQSNPETGQAAFTPEALEKKDPPKTWKEAEAAAKERLGIAEQAAPAEAPQPKPEGEAAPTGAEPAAQEATDPWTAQYDPELPEADVALDITEQLDDEELKLALEADDPIAAAADLIENRPPLNPDAVAAVNPDLARVDGAAVTPPTTPWRSQWQALTTDQLQAMALRSPEVADRVLTMTGKSVEEASKADLLDALTALSADGALYMPGRFDQSAVMATSDLSVDPGRFQYKQGVDAKGQQKGASLEGVARWNTDLEQPLDVWDDPADGKTYVVNGHNRHGLADRTGVPSLPVRRILAEDSTQARAIGALSNIAQGAGTPFDAAKFFRDSGMTDPAAIQNLDLPLKSGMAQQGMALAKLPQNIFQDAVDGKITLDKAVLLGEAGLDEAAMQQAYKLLQGRDMSKETWAEVLQQAGSAPTVEGNQVDLFGNTESINLMVQKADLARQIRAEVSGDKKLFGRTAKNAGKLEGAGNKIDATASADVASQAAALLDAFDREKYLAGSPISELLNQGAAEIAAGAKPAVIAKRLKGQLVEAMGQVEMPAAKPQEAVDAVAPEEVATEPRPLGADERQAMQVAAVQKAAANGKVRPPATPIPEVPTSTANLKKAIADLEAGQVTDDVIRALDDEARLQEHYRKVEAEAEAAQVQEVRDAVGYDELSFEQKKALGITDGFEPPDTRGGGRFFHGAAGDIELRPGGEFEGDGMNIYGDGFYATDDLNTANKYQKKNKGDKNARVTYEVKEKNPVKFYDLDKPADAFVLNRLRDAAGYDNMRDLIETAIDQFDGKPSLAEVFDEMRAYSREFEIPAYEIQETWNGFIDALKGEGYGGFTHQGGKLAGGGKRLHQVRIYWDPSDSIEINKVDRNGNQLSDARAYSDDGPGGGMDMPADEGFLDLPPWEELTPFQKGRFAQYKELTDDLGAVIKSVAGPDVKVEFNLTPYVMQRPTAWGGGKEMTAIGGWYSPEQDLIALNDLMNRTDSALVQTAYHESFHRIQHALLTKQEMEVLNSIPAQLKLVAASSSRLAAGQKINLLEHQAVAFQRYAYARMMGMDPVGYMLDGYDKATPAALRFLSAKVMPIFDKIMNVVERVNNWAQGRGFQSLRDVFERAYSGDMAQREPDFALEYITKDQQARTRILENWRSKRYEIDTRIEGLNAEMNRIRSMAAKGGC